MSNKNNYKRICFFLFHNLQYRHLKEKIGGGILAYRLVYEGRMVTHEKMFFFNAIVWCNTVVVGVAVGTIFSSSCSLCPQLKCKHRWPCWVRVLLYVFFSFLQLASAQRTKEWKFTLCIQESYITPSNRFFFMLGEL
jgi:hypothetical protein